MSLEEKYKKLDEKYQKAVSSLREIAKRGQEGSGPHYCELSADYYSGYDAGLQSAGYEAEDALFLLEEKVKL